MMEINTRQSCIRPGEVDMATRRSLYGIIIVDILCVLLVGLTTLALYLYDKPFKRGFFCDDESIRYPVPTSETVSGVAVAVSALGIPFVVVLLTEIVIHDSRLPSSLTFFNWTPKVWMVRVYDTAGVYLYGAGLSHTTVEAAKLIVGRLRPHFYEACKPLVSCNPNEHVYITDFRCTGDPAVILEARLSFPSGHASICFYAATFTVAYLQSRMTWRGSHLLRHTLQFILVLGALFTALSRVSDYMHHWSDVLAGMAIGILCAVLTVVFIASMQCRKLSADALELLALMRKPNSGYAATDSSPTTESSNVC